jgi:hypothetical protein
MANRDAQARISFLGLEAGMEAGSKKLEAGKAATLQGTKPHLASSLELPVS